MAELVGVVFQDPAAGFVTDLVEEELAYGMEQLGVAPGVMRKRVEETLDLLGIAHLRRRPVATLSGGEQQRVAIGAVLTAHPRVLVLDEPTSALDPTAAEEVLAAVARLVHDLAMTVVMAEHRLERVVQYADLAVRLDGSGMGLGGPPADVLATGDTAPPVVMLGRLAGWDPVPLTIRDARRHADGAAAAATRRSAPAAYAPTGAGRAQGQGCHRHPRLHRGGALARPRGRGGRGGRPHGSQRLGQDVAVVGVAGQRSAARRRGHRGRKRSRRGDPFRSTPPRCHGAPRSRRPAVRRLGRRRVCRRRRRVGGPAGNVPGPARPDPSRRPGRPASCRPLRGPAVGAGARHPARRLPAGTAARRADPGPRLHRQAPPERGARLARSRGTGGDRRHPRCRVRRLDRAAGWW